MSPTTNVAARYLPLLVAGEATALLTLFTPVGLPSIDDPQRGLITGAEEIRQFVSEMAHFWQTHQAVAELFALTTTASRSVAEMYLHVMSATHDPIVLPVAVVADHVSEQPLQAHGTIRVYYSNWPLRGKHRVRSPLLSPDARLMPTDVIAAYQLALHRGNVADIVALFEQRNGYFREPSGVAFTHQGAEALSRFFTGLFAIGDVPLQYCTLTDDGRCCAIEYQVAQWGDIPIAPQAGVAIYERTPDGTALAAARVYDDIAVEEGMNLRQRPTTSPSETGPDGN